VSEQLYSILVGTGGLTLAAVIAIFLTLTRPTTSDAILERRLIVVAALALVLQSLHFTEDLVTGFNVLFPKLLGLSPWPLSFFVTLNLFWIAVWILSIAGIRARLQIALFPVWFLGIGCVANGVAHPVFAMMVRGYFPGLYTSPLVGVAGLFLLGRLSAATAAQTSPASKGGRERRAQGGGAL